MDSLTTDCSLCSLRRSYILSTMGAQQHWFFGSKLMGLITRSIFNLFDVGSFPEIYELNRLKASYRSSFERALSREFYGLDSDME